MNNIRLCADNRYHDRTNAPLPAASGLSNEFDYDDPDLMDMELFAPEHPWADTNDIKAVRDFILNCSLYITDLETALGSAYGLQRQEFWEAREHAYRIISSLLIDLYQYDID